MSTVLPTSHRSVQYFSLTQAFKLFRQLCERDASTSIDNLEVNAAEFLDDILTHIGLIEARRIEVLGPHGAMHVATLKSTCIALVVKH